MFLGSYRRLMSCLRANPGRTCVGALAVLLFAGLVCLTWLRFEAAYHFRAAQAALERNDLSGGWKHVRWYLAVCPWSAEGHFLAARTARRGGLYGEAGKHLEAYQRLRGRTDELSLEYALLRVQRGEVAPNLEDYLLACVAQEHPDTPYILEALSQGYVKQYRLSDALWCLQELLKRRPDHVFALMRSAWVHERMNNFEEAMRTYEKVLEIDPGQREARLKLAQALLHGKNDPLGAVGHFERLHQEGPGDVAAALGLAECWQVFGRTEDAQQLLDQVLAAHPDDGLVLTSRGSLALNMGQDAEAERLLRRAVTQVPHSYLANYSLYLCLVRRGQSAEAAQVKARLDALDADTNEMQRLTHELQKKPSDPDLRCRIATIFMRMGEEEEAERWYSTALQMAPTHRRAHEALAEYYERKGKHDLAERHRAALTASAPPPVPPETLDRDLSPSLIPLSPP